ncbi:MAG TPA: M1 family metallopeptidase [Puia sp.]|nr:M1 family metallopeptidase [Puia sp.]
MLRIAFLFFGLSFSAAQFCVAQEAGAGKKFTHADTLRGSINPERAWWDVVHYSIAVTPDYDKKFIKGSNEIRFRVLQSGKTMQIDMQEPMKIVSIIWKGAALKFVREGNAFHVQFPAELPKGGLEIITVNFEGYPRVAVRPPWDGGWIFTRDKLGRPWMTVACQGLGASVWYPCKDHQSDEPDSGATLSVTVPDTLVAVGNGRMVSGGDVHAGSGSVGGAAGTHGSTSPGGKTTYIWNVVDPINNYDIIPYIGKYVNWHEEYAGEKGKLDCNFWVMDYNLKIAKAQFKQADSMLHCFEYWMGPYPFYEDGYKLVEAPHLGMEHQSAVAYGNHFGNGYLGRDLSGTGWGLKWDFIIVHESGHEWFGNNITTNDLADMWVHEGFTNYSETLYTTCQDGVEAGNDYCIGTRKNIRNDKPVIAAYGVNEEGSGDMYYKGGNMLHIIRQILGDPAFRGLLRGLNADFYHKTVTSAQIEQYASRYAHKDLSKIFDQYLRTVQVPVLEYRINAAGGAVYRWTNCIKGFDMPVKAKVGTQADAWIFPTEEWKTSIGDGPATDIAPARAGRFSIDRNFYVTLKKVDQE